MYKWWLFVLVILLSASLTYGQSCGDNQCDSSSIIVNSGQQITVTDVNGQSKTLTLTDVPGLDFAIISVGGLDVTLTTGEMKIVDGVAVTLDNVIYNSQNPQSSTVELSTSENFLSCQQDCKFTGRILTGKTSSNAMSSEISCDDKACYILYINSFAGGDVYLSILNLQTGDFSVRDQRLSLVGIINSGDFDVIAGDDEALVTWIENDRVKAVRVSPQGILSFVSPSFTSTCSLSGCISEDTTSSKSNPTAAWDSVAKRYLVSWEQCQGQCWIDKDIWATFIGRGQDYPDGYLINSQDVSEGFDFIYVPTSQSYLGVWEENGAIKSGAWNRTAGPSSFSSGPPASGYLNINLPGNQFTPLIVNGTNNFLTVFNDNRGGSSDVYGQLLQTTIQILPGLNMPPKVTNVQTLGSDFISTTVLTQPNIETIRGVAYNPDDDEYVVVGDVALYKSEIFLTRLDKDGNILGGRVLERYRLPDIQWISSLGKYIITAEDVRNQQVNEPFKVYSIFLEKNLSTSYSQRGTVISPPTNQNEYKAPTSSAMPGYETWIIDLSGTTARLNNGDKIGYIPSSPNNLGSQYFILFNHTSGPRATFLTDASKVIDLSSIVIQASQIATAIDDTGIDKAVVEKFSLHIPSTQIGQNIRVCPNATTLSQIVSSCLNEAIFRNVNHTLQNQTVNGITMGAVFGLDNSSYVVFAPGTGAEIMSSGSGTSSLIINYTKNKKANESVLFTADYKDGQGNPIQNATCNITFKVKPIGTSIKIFNMTFNSSSDLYEYNTSFNQVTSEYEIACSASGYPSQKKGTSFTILAAGADVPPTVTLTKPTTTVTNTKRPVVECSATDDKKLTSIDVYTDFTGAWNLTDTKTLNGSSGIISYQPPQELPDKTYTIACAATDDKQQKTFSANKTLTVRFSAAKPACSITDFAKGLWSNSKNQCGTRIVTLQNQNCDPNHSNTRKPAETKVCPQTRVCADNDYRKGAWGACQNGNQTRTLMLKSSAQCNGPEQKPETRSCQAEFPWLLVIIIIIVVIGAVLGVFFFLHRKGKVSEEDYDSDEYGDEDFPPEEGGDKSDEDTLWDKNKK